MTSASRRYHGLLAVICCALSMSLLAAEPLWSDREKRILASLQLKPAKAPPASESNRFADDPAAAAFGKQLFFDPRLSRDGELSCASCHQPHRYFTDGLPRAVGSGQVARNTPTVVGSAYLSWFYWDGRRDSLWSQALIPFEAADEMGGSRMAVVRLVGADGKYRKQYEAIFGPFPTLVLAESLPEHAGPYGDRHSRAAWSRLPRATARTINRVYANVGKAIAAYERTLLPTPSRFDGYVSQVLSKGDGPMGELLSNREIAGLKLFIDSKRTQCLQCHNGPMFTNGGFHNIGTGNFSGEHLDFGRVFGVRAVLMDEFNCLGPYSDAQPEQCMELRFLNKSAHVPLEGAFKVPGLRGLAATGPYMHDGRFDTLHAVLEYYRQPPDTEQHSHELNALALSNSELGQLPAFLLSLTPG